MTVFAANPLIEVAPGLMIWTLVCFGITFWVLKRFFFGPVQEAIDKRRQRIREAIEEADKARAEARKLLEEHKALIQGARGDAEQRSPAARNDCSDGSGHERITLRLPSDRCLSCRECTESC